jgi:hypothetical protein
MKRGESQVLVSYVLSVFMVEIMSVLLSMVTTVFVGMLGYLQHSTWLILTSQKSALNSSCKNNRGL